MPDVRMLELSPFACEPNAPHAGGVFLYNYIRVMAEKNEIVFGTTAEDQQQFIPGLPEVRVLRLPVAAYTSFGKVTRLAQEVRAGFSPHPAALQRIMRSTLISDEVLRADAVTLHWSAFLPAVPWLRSRNANATLAVIAYDILSLARLRGRSSRQLSVRLAGYVFGTRGLRSEVGLMNDADIISVFTHEDAEFLVSNGLDQRPCIQPPWLESPRDVVSPSECEEQVLFVGAFDRAENWEGAVWFLDCVWPRVKATCPNARVIFAGARPPRVLQDRSKSDVIVTGYLPSLDDEYNKSAVVVAPLLRGSGLKFKVPQALAYGRPVVATRIAVEGLPTNAGGLLVADQPAEMAEEVSQLLRDLKLRDAMGLAARDWVRDVYAFEQRLRDYEQELRTRISGAS